MIKNIPKIKNEIQYWNAEIDISRTKIGDEWIGQKISYFNQEDELYHEGTIILSTKHEIKYKSGKISVYYKYKVNFETYSKIFTIKQMRIVKTKQYIYYDPRADMRDFVWSLKKFTFDDKTCIKNGNLSYRVRFNNIFHVMKKTILLFF